MTEEKIMEIWKPIPLPDYVEAYEVSNYGRVRSLFCAGYRRKYPKIKVPTNNQVSGYPYVLLKYEQ